MKRYNIICATMNDGNVQKISRHAVSTQRGALRVAKNGKLWMTRETAESLGGHNESFWGVFPDGTEYEIKTVEAMQRA